MNVQCTNCSPQICETCGKSGAKKRVSFNKFIHWECKLSYVSYYKLTPKKCEMCWKRTYHWVTEVSSPHVVPFAKRRFG